MPDNRQPYADGPRPSPEASPVLGRLAICCCPDLNQVGQVFTIRGAQTAIGRAAANTVVIRDPDMSGYHARVLARGGDLLLIDMRSTNGTWVNGVRITEHHLRAADTILLGSTTCAFDTP